MEKLHHLLECFNQSINQSINQLINQLIGWSYHITFNAQRIRLRVRKKWIPCNCLYRIVSFCFQSLSIICWASLTLSNVISNFMARCLILAMCFTCVCVCMIYVYEHDSRSREPIDPLFLDELNKWNNYNPRI